MLTVRNFWPQALPHNQERAEVRILAVLVLVFYCGNLMETILYSLAVADSVLYRIANMTHNVIGVAIWFAACAALVLPHFMSLLFLPDQLVIKWPRQLACAGASSATVMWFYLAYQSYPTDFGESVTFMYSVRALANLAFAAFLAFSLNAQQLRPKFNEERSLD